MLKNVMRLTLLVSALVSMTACASYFLRKDCEKTNWFQHGQDVAMKGQSLENDNFVNQCRKVEAQIGERALDEGFKKGRATYCEPVTAFQTGKRGEPFASEMCDGGNLRNLRAHHALGVKEFCQVTNGETAGATGVPYKNVCPKDLEAKFMVEFKKGRKRFLAAEVESRETQIQDIDEELTSLDHDRENKTYQLASIRGPQKVTINRARSGSSYASTSVDQVTVAEDDSVKMQRESIQRDIDQLNWQMRDKRARKEQIREEVRKLRSEMLTL